MKKIILWFLPIILTFVIHLLFFGKVDGVLIWLPVIILYGGIMFLSFIVFFIAMIYGIVKGARNYQELKRTAKNG